MEAGINSPPFHPYCRCTTCPYFDDMEGDRASRNDEGKTVYEVPANMKYEEWHKTFVDGGSKEKLVLQEFKSVALGELSYVLINNIEYGVKKLETSRYDTYISSEINLKPKQLHYFENNIAKALQALEVDNVENLPKFYIVSSKEMSTGALARFNAKENTLMFDVSFCDKKKLLTMQVGGACAENELSTAVHELLHWMDAQYYIKKYGAITDQNQYIKHLIKKHQEVIEKLVEKGYNLYGISNYANRMILDGRFDEVYTEYRVKQNLGR